MSLSKCRKYNVLFCHAEISGWWFRGVLIAQAFVRTIFGTIVPGLSTVALVYATIQAGTDNVSLAVSAIPSESPLGHIQKPPLDITRVQSPQMERPS